MVIDQSMRLLVTSMKTYHVNPRAMTIQTIVEFDALLAHVHTREGPMCISQIDRDKYCVLREDIDLHNVVRFRVRVDQTTRAPSLSSDLTWLSRNPGSRVWRKRMC